MFLCAVLLAALSVFGAAIAEDDDSDYTVWADKLNVRESAGADATIVTVLGKGDKVQVDWSQTWVESDGYHWVKVKCSDGEGWVVKFFIFPTASFEVLVKANELGKANKANEMIAELKKNFEVSVSPDNKKAVFEESSIFDWQCAGPVACFNAGEGLADYIPAMTGINISSVVWSADSRYLASYYSPVYYGTLWIYDTSKHKIFTTYPHTVFIGAFAEKSYEFVDGYFVWLAVDKSRSIGGFDDVMLPYLVIYKLESGTTNVALTYDIQTFRKNKDSKELEVKLIPIDSVPPEVMSSPLYKRCVNQYVKVAFSEA